MKELTRLPRAVLFDWDSTLADCWDVIMAGMNAARSRFALETWEREEVIEHATHSRRDAFPVMFGEDHEEAKRIFYEVVTERHVFDVRKMPDSEEIITFLHGQGIPIGIVSNKHGDLLRKEVVALGWARLIGAVVGAHDAMRDKPAPDPVFLALEKLDIPASKDILFVGDTYVDIECGQSAGLTTVLIENNAGLAVMKDETKPDMSFLVMADLLHLLKRLSAPI